MFGEIVSRYCRVRSQSDGDALPFPLDQDGFLDDSAHLRVSPAAPDHEGRLVTLAEVVSRHRAVVLLGEPGLGKSTEFNRLSDWSGADPVMVDAADVTDSVAFDALIGRHIQALPPTGASSPAPALVIVIDQLDESPLLQQAAGHFNRALDGRDTSNLRLLIGCRTADLPPNLEDTLRKRFDGFVVADLAPLTRADATRLASSSGVDGDALVAAAVANQVAAWATVPLTLELLVRAFVNRQTVALPPTVLFGDGVLQLADEHDQNRVVQVLRSTPHQRVAIAERAAALLVISGRRTIWHGNALGAGDQDLDANTLVGGYESVNDVPFEVDRAHVRETLGTALFTGRGANRVAFRHGSFAAFLAARYLIRRRLPVAQLRQLLLIPAGGQALTVPVSLRETAAWLVALDPNSSQWLVDEDPEGIIAHSPLLGPEGRRRLVNAMLQRAGEVEAGDLPWARTAIRVAHPGLEPQLLEALRDIGTEQPRSWEEQARVRLAVRLAATADAISADFADRLMELAEQDGWDTTTRIFAASTALRASPDAASGRLRTLLRRLDGRDATPNEHDPDMELRGTLLHLLWPKHLPTSEALTLLERPSAPYYFGAYRNFQITFAANLPEPDFVATLEWARGALDRNTDDAQTASFDEPGSNSGPDQHLLEMILGRVLASPAANDCLSEVASVLFRLIRRGAHRELPAPIDAVDASGAEPATVRELRRAVAKALLEHAIETGECSYADIIELVRGWSSARSGLVPGNHSDLRRGGRGCLLDAADFAWLYQVTAEAASRGDDRLADATATAAAFVFDPADAASRELALHDQSHPVYDRVKQRLEPTPTDSEAARRWRTREKQRVERKSAKINELQAAVLNEYADAVTGDTDAFWRLVRDLQFDPATARLRPDPDTDLLAFPGVALLPADHRGPLADAALRYVLAEHDHFDEWVRGDPDRKARAGYLALDLLQRLGRLGEIPNDRWPAWVNAIVSFHAYQGGSAAERAKRSLLAEACRHAPRELADAVRAHVRSGLENGSVASVESVDVTMADDLADAFVDTLSDIVAAITGRESKVVLSPPDRTGAALTLFEQILSELLRAGDERGVTQAASILSIDGDTDERLQLAGRAGRALLRSDAARHLPVVLDATRERPTVGRAVALAFASAHDPRAVVAALPVDQQVEVFRWYASLFPPEDDPAWPAGFGYVSESMEARLLRDRVLDILTRAGTVEAADALDRLAHDYPHHVTVRFHLARARAAASTYGWTAPGPDGVRRLIEDSTRRLARTSLELRDIVLDVLAEIAAEVGKHGDLLWDRIPRTRPAPDEWQPKLEYALQAYLAHELDLRLTRRGVIVNREVVVRPTDATSGAGDRVDILVQATGPGTTGTLTTVIEIKGPWHEKLLTAMREQLVGYLEAENTTAGIYLVGWYDLQKWRSRDWKRGPASQHDPQRLRHTLTEQAATIRSESDHDITLVIFEVPLPIRPADPLVSRGSRKRTAKAASAPHGAALGHDLPANEPPAATDVVTPRKRTSKSARRPALPAEIGRPLPRSAGRAFPNS